MAIRFPISALDYGNGNKVQYTYDANGNILSVSDGTNTTSYVYDGANQLVRENNQAAGKTWVWTYDDAGNILNRREYAYSTGTLGTPIDTVDYTYTDSQWGDWLSSYDGITVTHDNLGNTLYDGTRSYTWEHGRQLASVTQAGVTWQNTYNADGLRTKRTDGTNTYEYVYNGGLLSWMKKGSDVLLFSYDASGLPMTLTHGSAVYYYVTNLQGDVMGILNSSGQVVVQYTYDAWGNLLSTTGTLADTLGVLNPLRYRGYVYDTEWGLYYLQSRYYDPEIGRFLNADAFTSTGQGLLGNNMFAYCYNNPTIHKDVSGAIPICVVIDVDTETVSEENGSTQYATTISYQWTDSATLSTSEHKAVFEYTISGNGIISYNNAQEGSLQLISSAVSSALASEMRKQAKQKVPGSMKGRSVWGISFELQVHFLASAFGIKTGNTNTTDIGATKGDVGYDYNADWFEHPFRNLGKILDALFE